MGRKTGQAHVFPGPRRLSIPVMHLEGRMTRGAQASVAVLRRPPARRRPRDLTRPRPCPPP
jgi:hypothetical protein